MPRMLIGTNWLLGWSHTSDAADRQIKERFSTKEAFLPVLEVYLENGIDAIMGPVSTQPLCQEAIEYAEDKLGKKLIIIDTPAMNVDDSAAARAEAEAVVKHSAEIGSTFCLIHHTSVEQLVNSVEGNIVGRMTVLAEGAAARRDDIIYLEELPVFNPDGSIKA